MRPKATWLPFFVLVAAAPLFARPLHAQGISASALAESLFQEGKELMAGGRVGEACRKFEESQRVVPKLGTLLNLATCHEKEGRTASAWAEFSEAKARAARDGQHEREAYARERLAALEGRLSKLIVEVPHATDDLEVHVGDEALGRGAWGTAVRVDPGDIVIRAERPTGPTWRSLVSIPQGPATIRVSIPRLDTADSPAPAATARRREQADAPSAPTRSTGGVQRTLGWVALGAGAIGIGFGSYFGIRTFQLRDDSFPHCRGALCDEEGVRLRDGAHTSAVASTVLIGVGAAAAVAGIVLLATARGDGRVDTPSRERSRSGR